MLKYQPKPGSIVRCNFKGFIVPEIVKERPVLVIHRHPDHSKLVTVVPFSTKEPKELMQYHYQIDLMDKSWLKCDLVYVVSIERLSTYRNMQDENPLTVSEEVLSRVKEMVRNANGL